MCDEREYKQLELFLEEQKEEDELTNPKNAPEELENSNRIFKSATPNMTLVGMWNGFHLY